MSGQILVTDSLFIFKEHEDELVRNGFSVVRLDKPKASENELCQAIRGKVGYILGGIETVTSRVIEATDALRVIAFTGSGYSEFIPGYETATRKGIAITAAVGGNAEAVSEYTLALILMMARRVPLLSAPGGASFFIGDAFKDLTVGVIGFGHIGQAVATRCSSLGFKVLASSRSRTSGSLGPIRFVPIDELVSSSDLVTVHVDKLHGTGVLDASLIGRMKKGTVLINAAFPHAIDENAMFARICAKEIFGAFDAPVGQLPEGIPTGYYLQSNAQTAFNTNNANKTISDMVISSLLGILKTGNDKFLVNPDYKKWR